MRFYWTAALVCLICQAGPTWDSTFAKIAKDFPGTPNVTTAGLAVWLADSDRQQPVLLDVRAPAEFAVSHLRSSQNVSPTLQARELRLAKDQPIVAYCSVGYRSSALVERLRKAGFTRVYNLRGSLFAWANEGRPLWCGSKEAQTVHPFNGTWGKLLQSHRRHPIAAD